MNLGLVASRSRTDMFAEPGAYGRTLEDNHTERRGLRRDIRHRPQYLGRELLLQRGGGRLHVGTWIHPIVRQDPVQQS